MSFANSNYLQEDMNLSQEVLAYLAEKRMHAGKTTFILRSIKEDSESELEDVPFLNSDENTDSDSSDSEEEFAVWVRNRS